MTLINKFEPYIVMAYGTEKFEININKWILMVNLCPNII